MHSFLKALMWMLIGLTAVAAMHLYYVQEMLAALALFSILFGCVLVALLFGFILDLIGEALLGFVERRARELLRHAQTAAAGSERRLHG